MKEAVISHYLHNKQTEFRFIEVMLSSMLKGFWKRRILKSTLRLKTQRRHYSLRAFDEVDVPFKPIESPTLSLLIFLRYWRVRMAMQDLGGKCVFSSEWDKEAQNLQGKFWRTPFGDITKESVKGIYLTGLIFCVRVSHAKPFL